MSSEETHESAAPAIPVGTQVVTLIEVLGADGARLYPFNSVGVVVGEPDGGKGLCRVRFPDSGEAEFAQHEIVARKLFQRQATSIPRHSSDKAELYPYVIYRCVVGSRAYGLESDQSDVDRRGFYLPPAKKHWSLAGVPEQLENDETQEVYWELQKFLTLALKANPNVLECLYTPIVETATPLAQELLDMRGIFLTKLVYQTYNGYVLSQFKKMEQDLRTHGEIRWKHSMHLIRLLISGITILNEGFVPVRVEDYRDRLLAIKRGEVSWPEVNLWRLSLHKEFAQAFGTTSLPDRPDYKKADAYLIEARRSMVEE